MIQAGGIKTNKVYAQGQNKRTVNRRLIENYPGILKGNNLCLVYPEPLIFKCGNCH